MNRQFRKAYSASNHCKAGRDPHMPRVFLPFRSSEDSKEEKLSEHQLNCHNAPTRIRLPPGDRKLLQFKNVKNKIRLPFVAYCDTESLLIPIQKCTPPSTDPLTGINKSYTDKTHEHQIMSYGLYAVSDIHAQGEDSDFKNPIIYTQRDAPHHLIDNLLRMGTKVKEYYSLVNPIIMSSEEKLAHEYATV